MSHAVEQGAAHEHEHKVPYFLIAGTLLVMTVLTIAVSWVDMGKMNIVVAMLVASFKASLVMMFFMHLKYEKTTLILIALAPFALAAILLLALFPDVVFGG